MSFGLTMQTWIDFLGSLYDNENCYQIIWKFNSNSGKERAESNALGLINEV